MESAPRLAPGIPGDNHVRIHRFEQHHFWYRRMREAIPAFIGDRLFQPGVEVLDAGCDTGGFLLWMLDANPSPRPRASTSAPTRSDLPGHAFQADLSAVPVRALPFSDERFDVAVTKDVVQHVPEDDVQQSVHEMSGVLKPGGDPLPPHKRLEACAQGTSRLEGVMRTRTGSSVRWSASSQIPPSATSLAIGAMPRSSSAGRRRRTPSGTCR